MRQTRIFGIALVLVVLALIGLAAAIGMPGSWSIQREPAEEAPVTETAP